MFALGFLASKPTNIPKYSQVCIVIRLAVPPEIIRPKLDRLRELVSKMRIVREGEDVLADDVNLTVEATRLIIDILEEMLEYGQPCPGT